MYALNDLSTNFFIQCSSHFSSNLFLNILYRDIFIDYVWKILHLYEFMISPIFILIFFCCTVLLFQSHKNVQFSIYLVYGLKCYDILGQNALFCSINSSKSSFYLLIYSSAFFSIFACFPFSQFYMNVFELLSRDSNLFSSNLFLFHFLCCNNYSGFYFDHLFWIIYCRLSRAFYAFFDFYFLCWGANWYIASISFENICWLHYL